MCRPVARSLARLPDGGLLRELIRQISRTKSLENEIELLRAEAVGRALDDLTPRRAGEWFEVLVLDGFEDEGGFSEGARRRIRRLTCPTDALLSVVRAVAVGNEGAVASRLDRYLDAWSGAVLRDDFQSADGFARLAPPLSRATTRQDVFDEIVKRFGRTFDLVPSDEHARSRLWQDLARTLVASADRDVSSARRLAKRHAAELRAMPRERSLLIPC